VEAGPAVGKVKKKWGTLSVVSGFKGGGKYTERSDLLEIKSFKSVWFHGGCDGKKKKTEYQEESILAHNGEPVKITTEGIKRIGKKKVRTKNNSEDRCGQ